MRMIMHEKKRRSHWIVLFFSFIFFFAAIDCVQAQTVGKSKDLTELSISQLMQIEVAIVYGASKYEQSVIEAPASVSIISKQDIEAFGYRNLPDILRSIRGLYLTYDRNYHYLGFRGFASHGDYNTRFLLLIDGHRLNDNIYGMAALGTDFILDVDLIERVEVIRGPSSSIYGTSAFLGVINIITRKGMEIGGGEISAELGSLDTYKGRVSYGNTFQNGLEFILSATGFSSRGEKKLYFREFDDPSTNNGIVEKMDGDEYKSIFSTMSYKNFKLQGGFVTREKDIPTAPWGFDFNRSTKSIDDRGYLDLRYEHVFNEKVTITGRLYYDYYLYKGKYPIETVLNKDYSEGQWWGSEIQVNARIAKIHQVTAGVEYINSFKDIQSNYDESPYYLYLDERHDSDNWAVYVQDEFKVFDKITFNAGIRYDRYQTFGGTTNPRLAFIYQPIQGTIFKILYGQAFRAPCSYEMYYNDGGVSQKENTQLKPETIRSYEVNLEKYFVGNIRGGISIFTNKFKDMITLRTDPNDDLLVFQNIDKIETKGYEFEAEKKWQNGFKGLVSYAYQESKNRKTDEKLGNSPRHLAKINLIAPIIKEKLRMGIESQYISKRLLISRNETGSAFITNLTLSSRGYFNNLEISLSAYNLFDVTYDDPGSEEHEQDKLEQDGRSVRLKLIYRF